MDTKIRGGKYRDIPTFYDYAPKKNHILGLDCAGIVVALGSSKIGNVKIGDHVTCTTTPFGHGSNAEYASVKATKVALIPENVSFADAASLPVIGLTAFEGLEERLMVKKDEKVGLLIVNGAGGVGTAGQLTIMMSSLRLNTLTFSYSIGGSALSSSSYYCYCFSSRESAMVQGPWSNSRS